MIGRPYIWGLAVDGAVGAARVLALLRAEIATALTLCGLASARDVTRALVVPVGVVSG